MLIDRIMQCLGCSRQGEFELLIPVRERVVEHPHPGIVATINIQSIEALVVIVEPALVLMEVLVENCLRPVHLIPTR